jgi:DNA-binding response OmpR family regulator
MDFTQLYQQTKELSVLLVEDHEPTRVSLEEMLQDLFLEVKAFSNGSDALHYYRERYAQSNPLDLVITDIQMPHMNGVELTKQVKVLAPEQQIIVLSAHTDKEYLLELINTGISYFLTKPFEYDTFLKTLHSVSKNIIERGKDKKYETSAIVTLGETMQWDKEKRLLKYKHSGKSIDLSKNEMFLMETLAQNGEQITTTQFLIEKFYLEGIDINENGIRNLVLRIRKKLPEDVIGTVYGMGYKVFTTS